MYVELTKISHQCTNKKEVYIDFHHTNTTCKMVLLKSPPCFLEKPETRCWARFPRKKTTPRSELVKFHNASVRHIKPSPPAGDFFGAFSGPGWGRGGFLAVFALPGRTSPSFQMKRSRKRRKRRHRCCCGQ